MDAKIQTFHVNDLKRTKHATGNHKSSSNHLDPYEVMMTVNFTKSNKNKKISRRDSELFLSSSDYSQLFKNEKLKTLKDYWLDFNWIYQKTRTKSCP